MLAAASENSEAQFSATPFIAITGVYNAWPLRSMADDVFSPFEAAVGFLLFRLTI